MKVNVAAVLEDCIERGLRNALLNVDQVSFPYEELTPIVDNFRDRIMNEIDDYFDFEWFTLTQGRSIKRLLLFCLLALSMS